MNSPHGYLRLSLLPGVGPVLARRLITHFGGPEAVFSASAAALKSIKGIGEAKATAIRSAIDESARQLEHELTLANKLGASIIALDDPAYPALLAEIPDAPIVLYVLGDVHSFARMYTVAIVGSRACTAYGIEQAERFSAMLSQSGLCIVSGGARGIDTAAHRAALRVQGKTVAVLGCGLAHRYPPENASLFEQILNSGGSVVSELPLGVQPSAENFPARNRIISGLSLGVLVIEAPAQSGALITARLAAEEHGREVMVIPGRLDSKASEGSLELIKSGGAALVTSPADVIGLLEAPARHHHAGTHSDRYGSAMDSGLAPSDAAQAERAQLPMHRATTTSSPSIAARQSRATNSSLSLGGLTPVQRQILDGLIEAKSIDQLAHSTGLSPAALQADLTILEIRQLIVRKGSQFVRHVTH